MAQGARARGPLHRPYGIPEKPSLPIPDFSSFLQDATSIQCPALCPELRLHIATDLDELWRMQEQWLGRLGLAAPFWGLAWPGGQGLARFILDNPEAFRGKSVLDVGAGSGVCAIAAAKSGASRVDAADIDPYALDAIAANAQLNDVKIALLDRDPIGLAWRWDVVIAADIWYERFLAGRLTPWLRQAAEHGTTVLLGDIGRAYFPRSGVVEIGRYALPESHSAEQQEAATTGVWRVGRRPPDRHHSFGQDRHADGEC